MAWSICSKCNVHISIPESQTQVECPSCGARVAVAGDRWYCAKAKRKLGPFSFAQLRDRVRAGELAPSDMVLREGERKWVAAESLAGLFGPETPKEVPTFAKPPTPKAKSKPWLPWAIGGAATAFAGICCVGMIVVILFARGPGNDDTKKSAALSKKKTLHDDDLVKKFEPEKKVEPEKKPPTTIDLPKTIPGPKKLGKNPVLAKGLDSLEIDGVNYLNLGQPRVRAVFLETNSVDGQGYKDYTFEKVVEAPSGADFDAKKGLFTLEHTWGVAEIHYRKSGNRLDIAMTLHNQSQQTIANFEVALLELRFPIVPPNWAKGHPVMRNSLDDLALIEAELGQHRLFTCNSTIEPPMIVQFDQSKGGEWHKSLPLVLRGGVNVPEPGAYVMEPHGVPRIAPGKSLTLEISLRFEPASTTAPEALKDIFAKFRETHSPLVNWPDRRPIGMIMRASTAKQHMSPTNPRGWLNEPKLDVISPAGRKAFRATMIEDAQRSVKVIKDTGGQGMIFWDMEGQQNPHPISFIGDPKLAKQLAPEMDEAADDYFKVFRDAGLRTGVCIRPTQVYFNEADKAWSHGTGSDGGPGRGNLYPQLKPKDLPWWKFYPIAERLIDRIDYCKKRWGCTLFYVDTNGIYRQTGPDQKFMWHLVQADIWKRVRAKHPDVLLILELPRDDYAFHAACWASTAGYMEIDLGGFRTADYVRALFPDAFSVVVINDGDHIKNRAEIKRGVAQGDILMFRGWFDDDRNAWVKALYDEVKSGK